MPEVGDRLQALPGVSLDEGGTHYYREQDVGTVSSLDSEEIRILWERTGKTAAVPRLSWIGGFKVVAGGKELIDTVKVEKKREALEKARLRADAQDVRAKLHKGE